MRHTLIVDPLVEVGTLIGRDVLLMMAVYEDAIGLFVIKTSTGMCGTESHNIYFKNDVLFVEIEGQSFYFIEKHR